MYKVIRDFTDKETGVVYYAGDNYPEDGAAVTDKRLAELMGENEYKEAFIEALEGTKKPEKKPAKKATKKKG